MTGIIDTALALATQHLWQGAVLAGAALALIKLRALGPEARAWLLLAAFVLAAIAPLATLLPGPVAAAAHTPAAPRDPAVAVAVAGAGAGAAAPVPAPQPFTPADRGASRLSHLMIPKTLPAALVLVWLLGGMWQAMRLTDGWIQARRVRRAARAAPALASATADLLPRGTTIAVTVVDGPLVVGLVRPCILVPHVLAETLDAAALRGIVLQRWRSPLGEARDPAVRAYLTSKGAIAERK